MSQIGVIGLGVMGKNLIFNMVDHGFVVHVFNRTTSKTVEVEKVSPRIVGFDSLESFVASLQKPRKILMIVAAGKAVDEYIEKLNGLLEESDILIDGGNSDYRDTIRRANSCKFNFVGCGISGGEYGARNGPSLMIGCRQEAYEQIRNVMESISAKHSAVPCCGWLGNDGAGHFVKIVHNGIEYCEMQLLQEIYNLVQTPDKCLEIFKSLKDGRSGGYLVEICEKILMKRDSGDYVLYKIQDKAEQKGTGKMCIYSGLDADADVCLMAQAVFSRFMSNNKDRRMRFSESLKLESSNLNEKLNRDDLEKAFYLCKVLSYVQGIDLLSVNKKLYSWSYTIPEICKIWRNGCILRCKFLDVLSKMSEAENIELSEEFLSIVKECLPSLKRLCEYSVNNDVYTPMMISCLMLINGLRMYENNGILIQAMRDYFGRHGVIFKDGRHASVDWDE